MSPLALALAILAGLLAAIDLVRTRGTSLIGWAVVALALAVLLPHLAALD